MQPEKGDLRRASCEMRETQREGEFWEQGKEFVQKEEVDQLCQMLFIEN